MSKLSYEISTVISFLFSYQFSQLSVHGILLQVQSMEFSYHFSDVSSGWIQLSKLLTQRMREWP